MAKKEIDLARLATPQRPRPERDISPKRNTIAGGCASRAKRTPEERRAIWAARGRAALEVANARRGFTRWHKVSVALADGEWRTNGEIWKHTVGIRIKDLSSILGLMRRAGLVERMPTGAPKRTSTVNKASGKVLWWIPSQWAYRLTPKGREHAREGKRRRALE